MWDSHGPPTAWNVEKLVILEGNIGAYHSANIATKTGSNFQKVNLFIAKTKKPPVVSSDRPFSQSDNDRNHHLSYSDLSSMLGQKSN